jgi:NAD(P)-dependent dehydrogenase (short-subunit alcohol dehydrogenase family)
MDELRGKTAFVTGGASGIGLATAHKLGAEGMNLVIADVEEAALANAEVELSAAGYPVLGVRCDVRRVADLEAAAQATIAKFGGVHVVFNNAGVVATGRVEDLSLEAWEWVMDVNLWGVIHGCRVFLPIMKSQGGAGHIVNTASMAGLNSGPLMSPYFVSKFGVVALSESMWHEARIDNVPIGVSVLCPGFVKTRIHEADRNRPSELASAWVGDAGTEFIGRLSAGVESGREVTDVAGVIVDAIKANRFWILPHGEESHATVRRRAEAIIDGATPPLFGSATQ